ncbi:MAG: hypothetical protein A2521_09170 [Deltaproteobacteria bacterium RIFOXYD12_FULL_57_12]|nr:MAG: hypothetical protein A2521_09170 [Deltaproteobacteria bacterium RIFOXYD12_FULL_57_12]
MVRFRSLLILFVLVLLALLPPVSQGRAAVVTDIVNNLALDAVPLDVAVPAGGRNIFVLVEGGRVLIYGLDGQLQDTVTVAASVEGIEAAPNGDALFLRDRQRKSVQIVTLDYIVKINTANSPIKGKPEAPVTIAVFDDFECPYCAQLVPVLNEVVAKYAGKVKLAFKNHPLPNHKSAMSAAMAALAAKEQGKFWEFHDALYANYNKLNAEKIQEIGQQVGLDLEKFSRDRKSEKIQQLIEQDLQEAKEIGVRGTPSVFVNGRQLKDRSVEGFSAMIDKALAETGPQKTGGKGR